MGCFQLTRWRISQYLSVTSAGIDADDVLGTQGPIAPPRHKIEPRPTSYTSTSPSISRAGTDKLASFHLPPKPTFCMFRIVSPLRSFTTPLLRQSTPLTRVFLPPQSQQRSAMATTAGPIHEWLVIAPDFEGALEKRLSVRPKHMEGIKADPEAFWLWGVCVCVTTGAMLEEPVKEGDTSPPKMKGSALLVAAQTKEEVVERLQKDAYFKNEVWDWAKVQIIPFKSALRKAL
ncbi:hypothetical protein K504DRAFT_49565 [Pleomassaria siparia CBS 279.74]|uniref:YCII-related domain-containing protein n=1 Tax=Pleomassaria siparia CBS 279.74 TaxID=1314801 RepID=A0A6G1K2V2_9PLEO|nr:hypothetical protein K504DRAFT_49565 [Pleomassaria siparia CBS 279.74]